LRGGVVARKRVRPCNGFIAPMANSREEESMGEDLEGRETASMGTHARAPEPSAQYRSAPQERERGEERFVTHELKMYILGCNKKTLT